MNRIILKDKDLRAYWPFNGNLMDYSGNGFHARPQPHRYKDDGDSLWCGATSFGGTQVLSCVYSPYTTILPSGGTTSTLCGWFKVHNLPSSQTVGVSALYDGGSRLDIQMTSGNIFNANYFSGSGSVNFNDITPTVGRWYFLAIACEATRGYYYRDGAQAGNIAMTGTYVNPTQGFNWCIGGDDIHYGVGGAMNIKQVRVYQRVLQPHEINMLYYDGF